MQEQVEQWLRDAMASLKRLRKSAGLTQAQVAERMGTRQSVIARMERERSGRVSWKRYVAYCRACGYAPLDVELVDAAEREAIIQQREAAHDAHLADLAHSLPQTIARPMQPTISRPLQPTVGPWPLPPQTLAS